MQNEWLYIGIFLVIGIIVPIVPLVFSRLVAPRKPNPIKQSTYECGIETVGDSWVQFKANITFLRWSSWCLMWRQSSCSPGRCLETIAAVRGMEGVLFIAILVAGLGVCLAQGDAGMGLANKGK